MFTRKKKQTRLLGSSVWADPEILDRDQMLNAMSLIDQCFTRSCGCNHQDTHPHIASECVDGWHYLRREGADTVCPCSCAVRLMPDGSPGRTGPLGKATWTETHEAMIRRVLPILSASGASHLIRAWYSEHRRDPEGSCRANFLTRLADGWRPGRGPFLVEDGMKLVRRTAAAMTHPPSQDDIPF